MLKLCILVSSTLASYLFWWGADLLGADLFVGFIISGAGALAGCWVGWIIYRRFFE